MARTKRPAQQHVDTPPAKRKATGEYSSNSNTKKEMQRRSNMDEARRAHELQRRALNSKVSRAKTKLKKSIEFAAMSSEQQEAALESAAAAVRAEQ